MPHSKKHFILSLITCSFSCLLSLSGAEPARELLWPQGAPDAKGKDPKKDMPAITIYSPDKERLTLCH